MNKERISFENVCKTFSSKNGDNHVVENLTFSVHENEFLVLFGPGQCGKTTILNLLAGLETPSSGRIMVDEKPVTGPSPERGMIFYRGGAVLMSAISGIDQALWDIKGKFFAAPVYALLGGPCREHIDVYGAVQAEDDETLSRLALERVAEGYHAIKVKATTHAVRFVDSMKQVAEIERRIASLRQTVGDEIDIAVDFHGRIHKPMIKPILRALEPYHLLFVEEPVPAGNHTELAQIASYTSAPIAIGERLCSRWDYRGLLEQGGADILQPDLSHAGGISECRKIAAMAECYDVAVAPHCPIGPIAFAACLQLDSCIPNFCIQEQNKGLAYAAQNNCAYIEKPEQFTAQNGAIPLPQNPGLGIQVNEEQVIEMSKVGHRWRNPVWRDDAGAVAEW